MKMQTVKISEVAHVTDFVASGSFASIKANVTYRSEKSYAILIRTTDYNNGWNGEYVWVDEHSFSFLSKSNLRPKDVIISNVGSIGIVFQTPDLGVPMSLAPNAIMCRSLDSETLDQDFLYYYLKGPIGQHLIHSITSGSAQPKFNKTDFRNLEIKIPAIERQRHIGNILKRLDDKIELNRKMNETLEQMIRALFKSWFVDFDPVHAKAAGRQPAGMDKATAELFPDSFVDSELGKIPKGWRIGTISEIATNPKRGIQPGDIAPGTPYIGLEHMPRRSIALGDWADSNVVESGKNIFKKGEILFGKLRPYFHKVGLAQVDGVCSTDILVLSPISESWRGSLLCIASSDELIQFTNLASTGTKMPRTNWRDVGSFKIVIPCNEVAKKFTEWTSSLTDKIGQNLAESKVLTETRDILLPKLLSRG